MIRVRTTASLLLALGLAASYGCSSDPEGSARPGVAPTPGATVPRVAAQDVSIVLPLPETEADLETLLPGNARAAHGELVPSDAFGQLDTALDPRSAGPAGKTGEEARRGLRLVALRLDPCFASLATPPDAASCVRQMRLVFQGISRQPDGTLGADDGAVHVFVTLSRAELVDLVQRLVDLGKSSGGYAAGPLGVHPILAKEGLDGPFARGLRQLVLAYGGAERTTRMTFFHRTAARQSAWVFGLFERGASGFTRGTIATTGAQEQTVSGGLAMPGTLSGGVDPKTTASDDLTLLLDSAGADQAPAVEREKAFDAALRIENPRIHTTESIDCASCHVSTPALRVAQSRLGLSPQGRPSAFTSSLDLGFSAPAASLENLHAMSWLGRELGINQRTANDTAAVVEAWNAAYATP